MRDRVNVSIDHRLKNLFEALKESHGIEWNEMFEGAIIDFLVKLDPVQTLEFLIKREEEKQEERRIELIRVKANIHVLNIQKLDQERSSKEKEEKLQKKRQEVFRKDLKIYNDQWKRGSDNVNWTRIIDFGEFKNMNEAREWLEKELKEKGIMEKHHHYP